MKLNSPVQKIKLSQKNEITIDMSLSLHTKSTPVPELVRDKWTLFLEINKSFIPRETEGFDTFKDLAFSEIDRLYGCVGKGYIPKPSPYPKLIKDYPEF